MPFVIRTSDGRQYAVPTIDYANISPRCQRVVVFTDEKSRAILGPIHINTIIDQQANGE
jgi:hypothetical protein